MNWLNNRNIKATLKGSMVCLLKRYIGPFRTCRRWLAKTQWLSLPELQEIQLRLLKKLIRHCYNSVPFYQKIMDERAITVESIKCLEDIKQFPILTKQDVLKAGDSLFSKKYPKWITHIAHTGGTTGSRLTLKRDLWSIGNEHAFARRQFDWAGISLSDPCAYMMWRVVAAPGQKIDNPYVFDGAMKELILSTFHLSEDMVPTYAKAIADYKIKALVTYPSAAYVVARVCLNEGIRMPLKAVLTTSETLDSAKKETISKVFECKVYDFYGGSERVCYIQTCEHGSYHIIPEYGLTELIRAEPPNDDSYRIIATGFWNMAMPLIRYDTGDLLEPGSNTCQCGRAFPVVKKIIGRENAVLTTPSGRTLGSTALECIMENTLFAMQKMPVLEGQVIQESHDIMTLEYVPLKGFCQKDTDKLKSLVADNFPADFKVNIRPVEKISRSVSGKALSLVISTKLSKMNNNL